MTVDHQIQKNKIVYGSLMQTLSLVFAGMTLLFAIFSIIIGNHLSTLHAAQVKALEKSEILESESINQIQAALKNTQANLENAREEAEAEKKKVKQLTQKLTATHKELEKVKADLNIANQTVRTLQTGQSGMPASAIDTSPEALPANSLELSAQPPIFQEKTPADQSSSQTKLQSVEPALQAPPLIETPHEKSSPVIVSEPDNDSPDSPPSAKVGQEVPPNTSSTDGETASGRPSQPSVQTKDAQ